MTFKEFERLPDKPGKCELLRGEPIELPPNIVRNHCLGQDIFLALHYGVREATRELRGPGIGRSAPSGGILSFPSFLAKAGRKPYAASPGPRRLL